MVNKKQKNVTNLNSYKEAKVRLVVDRGEDRRQNTDESENRIFDQRISTRRKDDLEKQREEYELLKQENERLQERQRRLIISKPELVLYYAALILSVNVIFGWMAYLAVFMK